MSDELGELEGVITAEHRGARVFWIAAAGMQGLVDRLAVVLGEHLQDDDELHVTYNAMQSGWKNHEPKPGGFMRAATAGWTELNFEYSAFVVLRAGMPAAGGPVDEQACSDDEEPWEH
jgi:hypothetical protein